MPLLRIDIAANFAAFQDAMTAIGRSAKKTSTDLQGAFRGLNGALAGIGVSVSVGALASLVKSSIDAADHLNDLSKKTGIAVETLGGIGFAAEQAGSNLDGATKAMGKLNLAIAGAASGNQEFAEAFRVMGLSIRDDITGQIKGADAMLVEIASKFEHYKGGPREAALANGIFKKSYQDILPLLKDGGQALQDNLEYYKKFSGVSAKLAKDSDEFNDQLTKIKLLSKAAGNEIASELLPTMSQIAAKMIAAKESADGFSGAAKTIGTAFKGITVAGAGAIEIVGALGDNIGAMAAVLGRLNDFDFKGAVNIFGDNFEQRKKQFADFKKFAEGVFSGKTADTGPGISKGGASGDWEDAPGLSGGDGAKLASRALMDHLRAYESASEQERKILGSRNDMLQEFYQQDLLSIDQYYSAKDAAAKEALQAQQKNIDAEIALLRKSIPKGDLVAEADANGKIKELQDKRTELESDYNSQVTKGIIARTAAMKDFGREISATNDEFLEMQGQLEKLAAVRFDAEHAATSRRLNTQRQAAVDAGDTDKVAEIDQAMRQLDLMRAAAVAQGRINELLTEESRIQSDLQIATERADMAAESGSISQMEALKKIGDARRLAAADLQAAADVFAAAAANSPDERLKKQAEQFKLAADKMAASADLIRDRLRGVFETGFESFFDKLLSGTVSLKSAFKSLFSEIATDMAKLAIRDMSRTAFGKEGLFGNLLTSFAGLFKNANGDASKTDTTGITSAIAASVAPIGGMTTAVTGASAVIGTLTTTSLPALAFAADSAAAALASIAASNSTSSAAGLFGLFGGKVGSTADYANFDWLASAKGNIFATGSVVPFAKGGIPSSVVDAPTFFAMSGGRTGLMGEAGPEAIMPLHRDEHGALAIKVLGSSGGDYLLPLARDIDGKLSARDRMVQRFATGGVFGAGIGFPSMPTYPGAIMATQAVPIGSQRDGVTNNTRISVAVPQGTTAADANKIATQTAVALTRHQRRNM